MVIANTYRLVRAAPCAGPKCGHVDRIGNCPKTRVSSNVVLRRSCPIRQEPEGMLKQQSFPLDQVGEVGAEFGVGID